MPRKRLKTFTDQDARKHLQLAAREQAEAMWRKIVYGKYEGVDCSVLISQGEEQTVEDLEAAAFAAMQSRLDRPQVA